MPRVTGVRGSYALVGLGAFLAGTTHAPLTAIFLLTEMTASYDVTLPALVSSILALVVARAIEPESLDTYALARRGISLDIDKDRLALARIRTKEVMNSQPAKLQAEDQLQEIFAVVEKSGREILPVVNSEGGLLGVIAARNLVGLLLHSNDLRIWLTRPMSAAVISHR